MKYFLIAIFIVSATTAVFLSDSGDKYTCKYTRNFMNLEKIPFKKDIVIKHMMQDVDSACKKILSDLNDVDGEFRSKNLGYWFSYVGWE